MKNVVAFALLVLTLLSCSHNKAEHVEKAIYYWKNNVSHLELAEDSIIKTQRLTKMYVKFFEVEKNDIMGLIPVAKSKLFIYTQYNNLSIIPTVYLRNEVFIKSSRGSLDTLADNVNFLIQKYAEENFRYISTNINEYQMDCDWTPSSRDNYFYFLRRLKTLSKMRLSCTLRLYPYKYKTRMGVPPVDRAMLMCYNLINPLENHGKNSILDINELASYLSTEKYPLPLDFALPLYSWMQVYQNNKFAKVIYTDTQSIKAILRPQKKLWYEVKKDTVVNNFYLRAGDMVKIEEVSTADIHNAIELIKANVPFKDTITVSLFHLDDKQLSRYTNEELSGFYSAFIK